MPLPLQPPGGCPPERPRLGGPRVLVREEAQEDRAWLLYLTLAWSVVREVVGRVSATGWGDMILAVLFTSFVAGPIVALATMIFAFAFSSTGTEEDQRPTAV